MTLFNPSYQQLFNRNRGIVSSTEQEILENANVSVFGLGGLGGVICEILARSGIANFNLVDKDVFDVSNINRQIYADTDSIGRMKTIVTKEKLLKINPNIKASLFEKLDETNIDEILAGTDLALLALDETVPCIILSRKAKELDIPLIEGWALPFGNVRVFTKDTPSLEEVYSLPSISKTDLSGLTDDEKKSLNLQMLFELKKIEGITDYYNADAENRILEGRIPSFAPMVWLTSCIMAFEAIKVLLNKEEIALSPGMQIIDPYLFTSHKHSI